MASIVEGGDEGLLKEHFLDVVHENVQVIEHSFHVLLIIHQSLHLVNPAIQVHRLSEGLNLYALLFQIPSQLDIEQPQEVLLFGCECAIDFDVSRLCLV